MGYAREPFGRGEPLTNAEWGPSKRSEDAVPEAGCAGLRTTRKESNAQEALALDRHAGDRCRAACRRRLCLAGVQQLGQGWRQGREGWDAARRSEVGLRLHRSRA